MKKEAAYQTRTYPASRIGTIDIGVASKRKHHISALIELDVTEARRLIREKKRQGRKISFNTWFIKCVSAAVEAYPELQGIRKGNRKIIIYDDIDISIMIEREVEGVKVPLPYVIRGANHKSLVEIQDEIRAAQAQSINDEGDYVLGGGQNAFLSKLYYVLPGCIRRAAWRVIMGSPSITKQSMGTVMITSVGMAGRINGWVIPMSVHPLAFAVGSVIKKPGVVNNEIVVREYLYVTASVDHDVIDGVPAVKALGKLAELVEKGWGLDAEYMCVQTDQA
jgi:pyruvate/2-oxoglutarate dehydrogenase complex dihydrolipoamide acyltransferase (E2) component